MTAPRTLKYRGATYVQVTAAYKHGFYQGDKVRFKPDIAVKVIWVSQHSDDVVQLGGLTGTIVLATATQLRVKLDKKLPPVVNRWENTVLFLPHATADDAQHGEFPIAQVASYIEKL